jgi:hypothetical protein
LGDAQAGVGDSEFLLAAEIVRMIACQALANLDCLLVRREHVRASVVPAQVLGYVTQSQPGVREGGTRGKVLGVVVYLRLVGSYREP